VYGRKLCSITNRHKFRDFCLKIISPWMNTYTGFIRLFCATATETPKCKSSGFCRRGSFCHYGVLSRGLLSIPRAGRVTEADGRNGTYEWHEDVTNPLLRSMLWHLQCSVWCCSDDWAVRYVDQCVRIRRQIFVEMRKISGWNDTVRKVQPFNQSINHGKVTSRNLTRLAV